MSYISKLCRVSIHKDITESREQKENIEQENKKIIKTLALELIQKGTPIEKLAEISKLSIEEMT